MAGNAAVITRTIDLPVIADADTGYGNELNVTRTVQEYERAGLLDAQAMGYRLAILPSLLLSTMMEAADGVLASLKATHQPAAAVGKLNVADLVPPLPVGRVGYAAEPVPRRGCAGLWKQGGGVGFRVRGGRPGAAGGRWPGE